MENGLLEGLLIAAFNFFGYLIDLIPTIDIQGLTTLSSAINYMAKLVAGASILVPVTDIFLIISIAVSYKIFLFGVFVINWIIRRVGDVIP